LSYRKIYKEEHGNIPIDQEGRSYEIHHIDGDHSNNNPSNLKAVTIQEHYDIHYAQGDWSACHAIALRMETSHEEKSNLASLAAQKRIKEGKHNFITNNPVHQQIKEGRNAFLTNNPVYKQLENGTHTSQRLDSIQKMKETLELKNKLPEVIAKRKQTTRQQVINGTHNFLGGEIQRKANQRRLSEGTHPTQKPWICEHCNISGKGAANYKRWHGQNCKGKT
jgi:HNH endonuclease